MARRGKQAHTPDVRGEQLGERKQVQLNVDDARCKIVSISSSESENSVNLVDLHELDSEARNPTLPYNSGSSRGKGDGTHVWRDQLLSRKKHACETARSPLEGKCISPVSTLSPTPSAAKRAPSQPSRNASPRKQPIESQEQQLGTYLSLRDRQFATLHEELQHLRSMHTNLQGIIARKNQEIEELQCVVSKKKKEIEHLKAQLASATKQHPAASLPVLDDRGASARGIRDTIRPSLSLYARSSSAEKLSDKVTNEGGPAAKMLLELRQNVASRDTIIDNLRMELHALQHEKKETATRTSKMTAELEEARAMCEKFRSEVAAKDSLVSDLQRRLLSLPATTKALNMAAPHTSVTRSSAFEEAEDKISFRRPNERFYSLGDGIENVEGILRQAEASVFSPVKSAPFPGKHHEDSYGHVRLELDHLRRCLEREKEANSELERQWRRRREVDMRMAEVELNAARAEADAFRRELTKLQQQATVCNFAEAQLQTARTENDTLHQRVQELRDENNAQASREMELRNTVRLLRESCERHEEEVDLLRRRVNMMKDNEGRMREEIGVLEERLSSSERMRLAGHNGDASASCDINSYLSLMSLNAELQQRTKDLEDEIHRIRVSSEEAPPNDERGADDGGSSTQGVIELKRKWNSSQINEETEELDAGSPPELTKSDTQNAGPGITQLLKIGGLQSELLQLRKELDLTRSELTTLRLQQAKDSEHVRRVVQRKVTSLRAARSEIERLSIHIKQQEALIVELRRKCEDHQRLTGVQHSPCSATTASAARDRSHKCAALLDEKIVEEALRSESKKLDEEMNSLRQQLVKTLEERDHWKSLAAAVSIDTLPVVNTYKCLS
uniref:Uncharacterized protein n=1 Tax=Trypanosoma congolense (strain IL3000) TaxID=1068625 RepID=G0V0L8_TRYCI|nr:conserved hypothetical protein [Trypanosoma congolense IL3000]